MGRMTDDGRHEGAVEFVFADGMTGCSWSAGPIATNSLDGTLLEYNGWQHRTDAEVTAWRAVCTDASDNRGRACWRGPVWTRISTEAEQDLEQRRVFSEDSIVSDEVEARIMADWDRHIAGHEAAYPLPRPDADPRFNFGLIIDVAAVLSKHGYPEVQAGPDLVRLQQALFKFFYED